MAPAGPRKPARRGHARRRTNHHPPPRHRTRRTRRTPAPRRRPDLRPRARRADHHPAPSPQHRPQTTDEPTTILASAPAPDEEPTTFLRHDPPPAAQPAYAPIPTPSLAPPEPADEATSILQADASPRSATDSTEILPAALDGLPDTATSEGGQVSSRAWFDRRLRDFNHALLTHPDRPAPPRRRTPSAGPPARAT